MPPRPRIGISLDKCQAKIACLLHYHFAHSRDWRLAKNFIVKSIPGFGGGVFDTAISNLLRDEVLEATDDQWGNSLYCLTGKGVEWVESWSDEIYRENSIGISFPHSEAAADEISIPASDRTVTLNHNQPDYQETVVALDKVVEEFRNDHRLDNELGHEKGALLKALEGGRELLNDTVVNARIGVALLVEPLKRLVQKYDQALVGVLATAALEAVMKLFE